MVDASDLVVQLFLRSTSASVGYSQWLDITSRVRTEDGVSYSRGYSPDSTVLAPGTLDLVLDNRDGEYSPRNTASGKFGLLGRNTPIRVSLGTRPVGSAANQSQSSTAGQAPAVTDAGAAGCAVVYWTAAQPVMNVTAPSGRTERAEFDGTYATFEYADGTDVDGVLPASAATYSTTATSWAAAQVGLAGTWATTESDSALSGAAAQLDVSTSDGNWIFVGQAWSADPSDLMVAPFAVGPYPVEWAMVADSGQNTGPRVQGWFAYLPGTAAAYSIICVGDLVAADCYAFAYQSSNASSWSPRFTGVVREWPVRWDESGGQVTTPLQASGGLYQGRQDAVVQSTARTILTRGTTHYWPMEDSGGPGFDSATPGTPRLTATLTGGTDTAPVYATDDSYVGSLPLATFTDAGAYATGLVGSPGGASPGWLVGYFLRVPSGGAGAGANFTVIEFSGGDVNAFVVEYVSNTALRYRITFNDGTAQDTNTLDLTTAPAGGIDGRNLTIAIAGLNSGTSIAWELSVGDVTFVNGAPNQQLTFSSSVATKTWGTITGIRVGQEVGTSSTLLVNAPTIGHLFVTPVGFADTTSLQFAAGGCAEQGLGPWGIYGAAPLRVAVQTTVESGFELDQGPIVLGSAGERLQAMADQDQALVFDAAGFVGVNFLDRAMSESPASLAATFAYSAGRLADPLEPADDDQALLNRVTVTRPEGWGQATAEETDGTLGTGAVGVYSTSVACFPLTPTIAQDLASWIVASGTTDAQRWPAVTVDWSAPANVSATDLPLLTVGRWIELTGLPSYVGPNVELQIVGVRERVTAWGVRTTYTTRPAQPWRVVVIGSAEYGPLADAAAPTVSDNRLGY